MVSITQLCSPTGQVKTKLYFFPWAGGNQYSFRQVASFFPVNEEGIAIYGLHFSDRKTGKRFNTIQEIVATIREEFITHLTQANEPDEATAVKHVFFGYSLGGIVAYELLVSLPAPLQAKISNLVLCCVACPQYVTRKNIAHEDLHYDASDEELINHVIFLGGLPKSVPKVFLEKALPTIRIDYTAFETYRHEHEKPSLLSSLAMEVIYCSGDSLTPSLASVEGWREMIMPKNKQQLHLQLDHINAADEEEKGNEEKGEHEDGNDNSQCQVKFHSIDSSSHFYLIAPENMHYLAKLIKEAINY